MRDLASVCTIEKVWALEGKDKVQGAGFKENAYEVMVSKDIQPGMLVAFIQEGAVLPVCETWEWLRKRCYHDNLNGKEGFLIKPQKFSGIKSWGLAVPLNELGLDESAYKKLKAGDNLEELLHIWKYEPEEDASPRTSSNSKKAYPKWVKFCLSHSLTRWIGRIWQKKHQNSTGNFPTDLISKSDETTIQNMKGALEKFADKKVNITAKMEGQSCVSSDTVVDTEDGQKSIKEIIDTNYSGKVWSYNEEINKKELKSITNKSVLENDEKTEWFELELENGRKLKITGNDRVYLPDLKTYRRVDELKGNENFLLIN